MTDINLGFALCGSFCTYDRVFKALEGLAEEFTNIIPLLSEVSASVDSRFGTAESFRQRIREICGRDAILTIADAEPIGPKKLLDALVIAPCTGNTLAKLSRGIADGCVTMAAKSHLRNGRPLILAVSTNDGLGAAAENIGRLLVRKNVYFVPFYQDDPVGKPNSLVADMTLIGDTVRAALDGRQLEPRLLMK